MKTTWWLVIYMNYERDAEAYSSRLAAREEITDRTKRYYTKREDYRIVKVTAAKLAKER